MRRTATALILAASLLVPVVAPVVALAADPEESTTLAGVWNGNYVCAQGGMGLTLTLVASPDGRLTGTFSFYPSQGNPGTASGSFAMEGAWRSNGALTLTGDHWIERPEGYEMVNLEGQAYAGEPGEPVELAGEVTGLAGCTSWGVARQ